MVVVVLVVYWVWGVVVGVVVVVVVVVVYLRGHGEKGNLLSIDAMYQKLLFSHILP